MNEIWKIRNKDTGLYNKGGKQNYRDLWVRDGKTWNSLGKLRMHMHNNKKFYNENADQIEIVQFELDEKQKIECRDVIDDVIYSSIQRCSKEEQEKKNREIKQLEKKLAELKK